SVLIFSTGVDMRPTADGYVTVGVLGKPGVAEQVFAAIERGSKVNQDLSDKWDYWAYVEHRRGPPAAQHPAEELSHTLLFGGRHPTSRRRKPFVALFTRLPQQHQGEDEQQGIAEPTDTDRDVDGEADAARHREAGREHARGAIDAPQPW